MINKILIILFFISALSILYGTEATSTNELLNPYGIIDEYPWCYIYSKQDLISFPYVETTDKFSIDLNEWTIGHSIIFIYHGQIMEYNQRELFKLLNIDD